MRYLTALLFVLVFASCNNTTETTSTRDDSNKDSIVLDTKPATTPEPSGTDNCYMQVLQRDTIVLHIQETGNAISGKLSFDNYQKDGSTGTVSGKKEGDILQLIYSFTSEGTNSVMEVYFKEQGNDLLRGVGEMQTKGDTVYFTHPETINYPGNTVLKKMDCSQVPDKYK